jgi:hypothetical protein
MGIPCNQLDIMLLCDCGNPNVVLGNWSAFSAKVGFDFGVKFSGFCCAFQ